MEIAFGELHREGAIQDPDDIQGTALIDDAVPADIKACSEIAPLHNPVNLKGYFASRRLAPRARHVAVFDTAFHATLPRKAFLYRLPSRYYEQDKVRRYGFHGTSNRYILGRFAGIRGLSADDVKLIVCHLGNGCSVCAIGHGRSADVSMGFTPLEGLLMGSRCGDIDAAAVVYLMEKHGLSPAQTEQLLNRSRRSMAPTPSFSGAASVSTPPTSGPRCAGRSLLSASCWTQRETGPPSGRKEKSACPDDRPRHIPMCSEVGAAGGI